MKRDKSNINTLKYRKNLLTFAVLLKINLKIERHEEERES